MKTPHVLSKVGLVMTMFLFAGSPTKAADKFSRNVNFSGGVKELDQENWKPANSHAEVGVHLNFPTVTDSDRGLGYGLEAGTYLTLFQHLNVGGILRLSDADVTLNEVDGDAGGVHGHAIVGFHF